ncbi:serine hydrolase [Lacticaseibacillus chiayiensis]|uniref:Beta-lactamase family protein n=1 Tax=Lacticaseibacillus chiayiensis TaxID=2100821 RepID=A0A4Q1UEW2_9LACO|nr:serine hydrolase [Lacticaseibacillus chiayiensis]QVI34645.1 serine hydrolase [Lacticaseibacillus chiayiensis]RXT30646.1 serine hydrolase [Lacticaseibacillus chiayiensis]UYN56394.1 beta-lactamase family protein [Lacticaseibacillus chiayiensis]
MAVNADLETPITQAIHNKAVFGASFSLVAPDENALYFLGYQGTGDDHLPLMPQDRYDLASLTKVVGTTTRLLQLLVAGEIRLDQPIGSFVSGLRYPQLTVKQLMLHRSGLPADVVNAHDLDRAGLIKAVKTMAAIAPPDTVTIYSDLNYILLGWAIAQIEGSLATSLKQHIFEPLGMKTTGYQPHGISPDEFVPTEKVPDRGGILRGTVHDHKAFLLDGISGHAGLFATLGDLTTFTRLLAGLPVRNGESVLPPAAFSLLDHFCVGGRTLGWRCWSAKYHQYWHTGFTGTSIAFDRDTQRGFVCLTNRIYPTRVNRKWVRVRMQLLTRFFGVTTSWPND